MDEILRVDSIYLEKEKRIIIKDLSFSVPRHSISAILGRNGANKLILIHFCSFVLPCHEFLGRVFNFLSL